jgi:hypothetical protein
MKPAIRALIAASLLVAPARPVAAQEAKSLVSDLMTKGKSAFNDLKYKQADSLGRRVLSYAALLTPAQKVEAMQLVIAASYPEEESEQHADVAIELIKQMMALGSKQGIPRELSWPGLDSLHAWVVRATSGTQVAGATAPAPAAPAAAPQQPAQVRLGSPTPEAFLYVNDKIVGPISTVQYWNIPGGENVKLSIKSAKCTAPWDSTVNVAPGTQQPIGRRLAGGCQ